MFLHFHPVKTGLTAISFRFVNSQNLKLRNISTFFSLSLQFYFFRYMNAIIVSIGDEILIGQVINTNAAWMAERLNLAGIKVNEIISISDNSDHIKNTLSEYEGKTDLVIITGGLGPTKDDITKKTLAEYFNTKLVFHPEVMERIKDLFKKRGLKLREVNERQAMLPENCRIFVNPSGTAQGMWFEKGGTIFVSLPGVPYEMTDIVNLGLLNELKLRMSGPIILHKTMMTQGIPESYLSEKLAQWEDNLPLNFKLAYLPKPGMVRLRLTATGENREKLQELLDQEVKKALEILSDDVYGFDDEPLEKTLAEILVSRNASLSLAESCTGGKISELITSVPGSSRYFKGSVTAYSNEIKQHILGVSPEHIKKYGAVSREVVEGMAKGIMNLFNTDFAIATSGIAGPAGGSPEKPVGTTWIAVSSRNDIVTERFLFGEHRGRNIEKASYTALNMLRKMILQKK